MAPDGVEQSPTPSRYHRRNLVECVSGSFARSQQQLTFAKQLARRIDIRRDGLLPSLHTVDELNRCERSFDTCPRDDRQKPDPQGLVLRKRQLVPVARIRAPKLLSH